MNHIRRVQVVERTKNLVRDKHDLVMGEPDLVLTVDQFVQIRLHPLRNDIHVPWHTVDVADGHVHLLHDVGV